MDRKAEFLKIWTERVQRDHADALLSIEIKDGETGKTVSRKVYDLDPQDLRERGMVEEFTTAAERRRIERGADNGGLSPAT